MWGKPASLDIALLPERPSACPTTTHFHPHTRNERLTHLRLHPHPHFGSSQSCPIILFFARLVGATRNHTSGLQDARSLASEDVHGCRGPCFLP